MYARVENGSVVETFNELPENWGPHCGLPRFPKSFLIQQGFLECDEISPTITSTQKYDGMTFEVLIDKVIVTYIVVDKTPDEILEEQNHIIKSLVDVVQNHLDTTARTRNYDGILSLCTYATSTHVKFKSEGQAGVVWRDNVWDKCYQVMNDVLNGLRGIPTGEELILELPVFTWGE